MCRGVSSGLWSVFAEAIAELRPRVVIIENVRGLLSAKAHRNVESADTTLGDQSERPLLRAAGAVLGDLADLGYDAQWTTLAAGDVGAPHRRERVFIVATDSDAGGLGSRIGASRPAEGTEPEALARVARISPTRVLGVDLLPTPTCQDGKNNAGS